MVEEILRDNLDSFIYPLFIKKGIGVKESITSMPGVYRFSTDTLLSEADWLSKRGINKLLLFAVPENKDEWATQAYKENNVISGAVRLLKKHFPNLVIMTDVCLCAYTSHGHCGLLINSTKGVHIDQEQTLSVLAKIAVAHAASGADYVAPSAMTAQQVRTIRKALDKNGYEKTKIMGYSAKFASQFYGPFREAADSSPRFGDRRHYQLAFADSTGALKEVEEDIDEGADIVMVKPALAYLDVIRQVKDKFNFPLAVYNVSGEYAMVKTGSKNGYWNEQKMVAEIITAIKRAGADIIITYHARDIADWVKGKNQSEKKLVLQ